MDNMSEKSFFTSKLNVIAMGTLCAALWGSAAPIIKVGLEMFLIKNGEIFSRLVFAGFRFVIAGILVLLFSTVKKGRFVFPKRSTIGGIIAIGMTQTALQYLFFYIGVANTTGFKASVLSAAPSFFAVIIAHFIFKDDRITFYKALGCIIGAFGLLALGMGNQDSGSAESFSMFGDGFIVLAMLSFALSAPICKATSNYGDTEVITAYSLVIGGTTLTVIGFLGGGQLDNITVQGVLLLCYLGGLSAISVTVWNLLLKYNSVAMINMYNFLVPVFGTIFSALFLDENVFKFWNIFALILACVGICIVNIPAKSNNKVKKVCIDNM